MDVTAQPWAEDRTDPHAGEKQARHGAKKAAGKDIRSSGVNSGREEPSPRPKPMEYTYRSQGWEVSRTDMRAARARMERAAARVPTFSLPNRSDKNPQDWPRKRVTPNSAKMETLNMLP